MKKIITALSLSAFCVAFSSSAFAKEYECESKYCKEMSSCDEAFYQYQVCGFDKLDRDGDGVPCETVCGKGGVRQSKTSKKTIADILKKREQGVEETVTEEEKEGKAK